MTDRSHEALFNEMKDDGFVGRTTKYARWTLPQLMALADDTQSDTMRSVARDYQEVGPLLVNNLASKLVGLLFPVSRPFFGTLLTPEAEELVRTELNLSDSEMRNELVRYEKSASGSLLKNSAYMQLTMALKHLIVTGNVLIHRDPLSGQVTCYGLGQFSASRDTRGRLLDCVLRERTYFNALPYEVQQQLLAKDNSRYLRAARGEQRLEVKMYTRIQRFYARGGQVMYRVTQQVDRINVGTPGEYPEKLCPWVAPVWSIIAGENYGRGLVEDYAGGFAKMSELAYAGLLYDVNMMKVLNLASASALAGDDVDNMAKKETGEWVQGDPKSVSAYEAGDAQKSAAIEAKIQSTFQNLARAFMFTGNTRDAERVTAYEIRQNALEAEEALGGAFSTLGEGLQVPLAYLLLAAVSPYMHAALTTGMLTLDVEAGIPALSRSNNTQALLSAVSEASAVSVLSQLDRRVDQAKLLDVVFQGNSVDTSTIFKSAEQLQAEATAAQAEGEAQAAVLQGAELAAQTEALSQLPA